MKIIATSVPIPQFGNSMFLQQTIQPITYTGGVKFTSLITDDPVAGARRSEYQDYWMQPVNEVHTYGWQIKMPSDWEQDDEWCVISQMHDVGVGKSPSFVLEIIGGNLIVRIRNDADSSGVVYNQPVVFGEWMVFEMSVRWMTDANGTLSLTKDGIEIVNNSGANYYSGYTDGPYFKAGLYISGSSVVAKREIEIRV